MPGRCQVTVKAFHSITSVALALFDVISKTHAGRPAGVHIGLGRNVRRLPKMSRGSVVPCRAADDGLPHTVAIRTPTEIPGQSGRLRR